MQKNIFNKFKKSLAQSSRVVNSAHLPEEIQYQTINDRQWPNTHHSLQKYELQNHERTKRTHKQHSNYSSNTLSVKLVPELMLQNDELRHQVDALLRERNQILSSFQNQIKHDGSRNGSFSFRNSVPFRQSKHLADLKDAIMGNQTKSKRYTLYGNEKDFLEELRSDEDQEDQSIRQKPHKRELSLEVRSFNDSREERRRIHKKKREIATDNVEEIKVSDKFYAFCKNQIVRVHSENGKLQGRINDLQAQIAVNSQKSNEFKDKIQLLQSQNGKILKAKQQLNQEIEKIMKKFEETLKNKQNTYSEQLKFYQQKNTEFKEQISKLEKRLLQKESQNIELISKVSLSDKHFGEFVKLKADHMKLINDYNDLSQAYKATSNMYIKSQRVDHLWQVKQIEYTNIMKILAEESKYRD